MKYRIDAPRMLIVSRLMGSRLRIVIFTVRSDVFIFTSTERIVPEMIVPGEHRDSLAAPPDRGKEGGFLITIFKFHRDGLVLAFH